MNNFERMHQIVYDYTEDFETDNSNPWVKNEKNLREKVKKMSNELDDALQDSIFAAQDLGFIIGMQFALDVMVNAKSKNTEILRAFLESIQKQEGEKENV